MQDNTMKLDDGRTLGYSVCGEENGIPIMFFHGTPGSRIFGLENGGLFKKYGAFVIAPERPGYGLSDRNPERTIESWATDIGELADHLGFHQFHVAGESGGGPYALACAINLPKRVLSATLIASATPPEALQSLTGMGLGNRIVFFLAMYAPFILRILFADYAHAVRKSPEQFMRNMLSQFCEWDRRIFDGANGTGRTHEIMLHLKEAFRQGGDGAYRDMLLISRPWRLDLSKLAIPVIMWHGESDTLMPIAPAKAFAKLIPDCESHFVVGAGHLLLEDEDVGSQIVARLLSVNA
ncbi:MAG: alpha/beta hydrolase [Candidatus Competibacter sp.]|nr:alpha/beta hydrolase [Candidatus Competibacter sp.]HRD48502.1 alpha/beta hydrolase [Candidatus Contendobacter sp.]